MATTQRSRLTDDRYVPESTVVLKTSCFQGNVTAYSGKYKTFKAGTKEPAEETFIAGVQGGNFTCIHLPKICIRVPSSIADAQKKKEVKAFNFAEYHGKQLSDAEYSSARARQSQTRSVYQQCISFYEESGTNLTQRGETCAPGHLSYNGSYWCSQLEPNIVEEPWTRAMMKNSCSNRLFIVFKCKSGKSYQAIIDSNSSANIEEYNESCTPEMIREVKGPSE